MKPASATLQTLLASRRFYRADLYTITLVDGTVLRYCAGDQDIEYDGEMFSAGGQTGPFFSVSRASGGRTTWRAGLEVDTATISVVPKDAQILGTSFKNACRWGILDGASLRRETAIMSTYGDTTPGTVLMFLGRIVEVTIMDQMVELHVNSPTELLDQMLPRTLFQPDCTNTLYDIHCGLVAADLAVDAAVAAGTSLRRLLVVGAGTPLSSFDNSYFDLGKVVFTGGVCDGLARSVRNWTKPSGGDLGSLTIWPPLPRLPTAGDALQIFPGCDKRVTTCTTKFNNLVNFRGFPDIPNVETAV